MTPPDDPPLFDRFPEEYADHARESAHNALYDRPAVLELPGPMKVVESSTSDAVRASTPKSSCAWRRGRRVRREPGWCASPALGAERDPTSGSTTCANRSGWLANETFDTALMALVIHHLDDRIAAFREVRRVLRPGGQLIVSTHHPMSDWLRLGGSYFTVEAIEEDWHDGRWHVRYWRLPLTRSSDQFREAGFLIERVVEPLPAAEMAARLPEYHEKLSREPAFIVFVLRKPSP